MFKSLSAVLTVGVIASAGSAFAADVSLGPPPSEPVPVHSPWEYEFQIPGWVMFIDGDITARGREVGVQTNIFEILDKGELNGAWMSYMEARRGPTAFYLDAIWADVGFAASSVAQRNPVAGLTITATTDIGMDFEMAIVEAGVKHEIARWGGSPTPYDAMVPGSFTALDVIGGARYWDVEATINLDATLAVNLPALGLTRTASGSVEAAGGADWVDPLVGLRLRHQLAPGSELILSGDIGGFGVGSDFSWQAVALYSWEFGEHEAHQWFAEVGYRALGIDYSSGSGTTRREFDMLMHGPVIGAGFRW